MIKEALQYLVSLKANQTYKIDELTYSDHELHRIDPPRYYKKNIEFGSLDAIVKMIRNEMEDYEASEGGLPVFIHIRDFDEVEVFTRPDLTETRFLEYGLAWLDVYRTECNPKMHQQYMNIIESAARVAAKLVGGQRRESDRDRQERRRPHVNREGQVPPPAAALPDLPRSGSADQ